MDLPRETATHAEDLPHRFQQQSPGSAVCSVCLRNGGDELHSQAARELASESGQPMPREIGS